MSAQVKSAVRVAPMIDHGDVGWASDADGWVDDVYALDFDGRVELPGSTT